MINEVIGKWNDVILFKLAKDLIDSVDDKDKIKIFISFIKNFNDNNPYTVKDLLSIAIYTCPHLEESFKKLIILI
jgi:hypothetical protein